jgi:uncharacterized membrane protein YdbT with pleckstrin-like domain
MNNNAVSSEGPVQIEASIRPAIPGIALSVLPLLVIFVVLYFLFHGMGSWIPGLEKSSTYQIWLDTNSYVWRFLLLLEVIRRYFNEVLLVTNQGLLHKKGILSIHCTTAAIQYSDIREVRVEQSILERIFNFGTLKVGTASIKDYEVVFRRMAHPHRLARWLQKERVGDPLLKESND